MVNALATETSPYLLQHKDNPVDWYPWGPAALEKARADDKPILLSIGYAACHWCHVMERESFEDAGIAEVMNRHFVNVKVDREERPDIDSIYMEAVQAMTGHGGWPMTVFLTPDGEPFYGGTYFPPEDRHGLPSFRKVLHAVADAWKQRRDEVRNQGRRLVDHMGVSSRLRPSHDPISESLLEDAVGNMAASFDPEYGGFGGAPKFPQPATIDLLQRMGARGHARAAGMAKLTLDRMAAGGIFDQLGGGFCRYSVDRHWEIPHFEKMLYDNAQLLRVYARSWVTTSDTRHHEVAEMTAAWMLGEMRDPDGGFWSSLDADSEGEEGKYYVWSLDEVREVCGADADVAIEHFGFTQQGNFEGRNHPVFAHSVDDEAALARARRALLEQRSTRVRPATDDKVLAGWNGLAAAALAESGAGLRKRAWVDAARETMDFVLGEMRVDGRMMRSYRAGEVKHLGVAEDYAATLSACLALYEATFERRWIDEALWAADEAMRLFLDPVAGGFYATGNDAETLIVRPKDLFDDATPSANSTFALELQRLALMTGRSEYEKAAIDCVRVCLETIPRAPLGFGHLLGAIDFYTSEPLEIVIVGDPKDADTRALLDAVRAHPVPASVLLVGDEGSGARLPLLEGRGRIDGRAAAYVCRRGVCDLPVTDPEDLAKQLGAS